MYIGVPAMVPACVRMQLTRPAHSLLPPEVPVLMTDCVRLPSLTARARPKSVSAHHARSLFHQDVGRLDVAVDYIAFVGGRQPLGRLQADAHYLGNGQRSGPLQAVVQGFSRDELHDQVRKGTSFSDLVDGDDMRVAHRRRSAGLAEEALAGIGARGQLRGQHLDSDDPLQVLVERLEDCPHAPLANDCQHLVAVQPPERSRLVRRGQECTDFVCDIGFGVGLAGKVGLRFFQAAAGQRAPAELVYDGHVQEFALALMSCQDAPTCRRRLASPEQACSR